MNKRIFQISVFSLIGFSLFTFSAKAMDYQEVLREEFQRNGSLIKQQSEDLSKNIRANDNLRKSSQKFISRALIDGRSGQSTNSRLLQNYYDHISYPNFIWIDRKALHYR